MGMIQTQPISSATNGEVKKLVSVNPATGEVLGEVPVNTPEEVRAAVARAREAQRAWSAVPLRERAQRILAFRNLFIERCDELVDLISMETGKPRQEALLAEVGSLANQITYFAKRLEKILAPRSVPMSMFVHRKSYLHYVPRGVVGVISPWNFPFVLSMGPVVLSLLAGNGAVLKPSEVTPLVLQKTKELYDASGLPPDLFQVVMGAGDVGAALIDSGVDQVVFVGSVAAGKKVARACGERLIPCTLELGGKAPAVVLPDADLDRTARNLVFGAFVNAGQACVCIERVYLPEEIHDVLVEKIVALTKELRQGDPLSFQTEVGAICFAPQMEVAKRHVQDAVAKGAKIEIGGVALEGNGLFFAPTVLTGVTHDMAVIREESFSPLMPIVKYRDIEEAIRLANDTHLGLGAYVFGNDKERAKKVAEQICAGMVLINDMGSNWAMPETPWAGLKESGLGKLFSDDGLRDFCQTRHVNYNAVKLLPRELWWYPYSEKGYQLFRTFFRAFYADGIVKRAKALFRREE